MFTQEDNELIQREFESLRIASLKRCANQEEYEDVVRAFEFANEAHKGVRRRSGEPYILHPIAVAKIVVEEIGLGYKSIVTALLHDIVEDTEYTVEDLSRLFGPKVASLVDGLTKIKSAMDNKHNSNKNDEVSMQAENFKRILLTLNDDVRVVLIKLADRLHNLRTIGSMPERKKDKILSESMYIFVPLAHKLGLYRMKSEMENIWLQYREPEYYAKITKQVQDLIDERGDSINQFIKPISQSLHYEGYKFTITKRIKSPYSIWKKMEKKGVPFEQIYDLFAVRIIFEPKEGINERKQCWDIYSIISEHYRSKMDSIRDWVSVPKSNGYEALHCTLMSQYGNWVEVQIRSDRMNQIAEKGVAAHWSYKGVNKSETELDNWLAMVREVLENPDVSALEFLDKFHEGLLSSEIYVFTPKGDSKALPKGATALDFAYYIHSKVGNKAIAAKVNHKLVPLSHELNNGDQIEIITAEAQKPEREWLGYAHTPKAKDLIYEALKAEIHDIMATGQRILEEELTKLGVKVQHRVIKKLLLEYKLNNKGELYTKIATGVVKLDDLDQILRKNNENKWVKYWKLQFFSSSDEENEDQDDMQDEEPIEKKPAIDKKKDYLLKDNIDKTLTYHIADCCNPIPGDAIIGFVDANNNVIIHKKICHDAISLATTQGEKIINAKWTKHTFLSFLVRMSLRGIDRMGIVNDITKYITLDLSVTIRKIHFETHDGIFDGYIDLYVHDAEDLEMIMKKILEIKGVESVTRTDIKTEVN